MSCTEFQKTLPEMIEGGGRIEESEHLRQCTVCSDLVADLRYIAEQAKLLVPMYDPSPAVWGNIRRSIDSEEPAQPARIAPQGLIEINKADRAQWKGLGWAAAIAAVVMLAVGLFLRNDQGATQTVASIPSAPAPALEQRQQQAASVNRDDQQLLDLVAERDPQMRSTYESGLQQVNAYISEAQKTVEQNPDDDMARGHLSEAYAQKQMLYEMAINN